MVNQTIISNIRMALFTALLVTSVSAHAVYNPNIEKPVQKAQTDVITAEGTFLNLSTQTAEVTKLVEDGSNDIKFAIQFRNQIQGFMTIEPAKTESFVVSITDIEPTNCGILYVGKYKDPQDPRHEMLLHVYDTAQNTEFCRVLDQWNIILESYTDKGLVGKLELSGVPQNVIRPTIVNGLGHYNKLPIINR